MAKVASERFSSTLWHLERQFYHRPNTWTHLCLADTGVRHRKKSPWKLNPSESKWNWNWNWKKKKKCLGGFIILVSTYKSLNGQQRKTNLFPKLWWFPRDAETQLCPFVSLNMKTWNDAGCCLKSTQSAWTGKTCLVLEKASRDVTPLSSLTP